MRSILRKKKSLNKNKQELRGQGIIRPYCDISYGRFLVEKSRQRLYANRNPNVPLYTRYQFMIFGICMSKNK